MHSLKRRRICRSRSRDSGDRLALPCLDECENDLYASLGLSRLIGDTLDGTHLAGYPRHQKIEREGRAFRKWNLEASRLILCYGAFGFSYIIPATFLPAMAQHIVSDPGVFGWMWPAFGAAAIVSTLVGGGLSKARRQSPTLGRQSASHGIRGALPALWHHLCSILVPALLVGGTFMVTSMAAVQ